MRRNQRQIAVITPGSKKNTFLLIFCFVLFTTVNAQPGEIVFTRAARENGLSATRIYSFIKDRQGYYWLSSVNGLQRFDGNRIVSFRHDPNDSSSLPDNNTGYLMEDNQKRLWVNAGGYPCIYNPLQRNFKKIPIESLGNKQLIIYSFFQDSRNRIWMLAPQEGFFVLDTVKNIFEPYTKLWPHFFSSVYYMTEDTETGRYWLTTDRGLVMYDQRKETYYHAGNNPEGLRCFDNKDLAGINHIIYLDKNKILWAHAWVDGKGFISFRYDTKKNELLYIENRNTQLWGFLTDRQGNTWGYGSILGRYDKNLNRFIEIPQKRNSLYGIDFNGILNMYEDSENNLWVLSDHGLYNFNLQQQYFTTVSLLNSLYEKREMDGNINGFIETNDGHIISLGWGGDGLYFFDTAFYQVPPLYGFNTGDYKKDNFFILTWKGIQDSKGIIWVGCQEGHILQINPFTKKIKKIIPPEFEKRTIRSITEDAEGNIWFGAQRSIIVKWDRASEKFSQITSEKNVSETPSWILSILPGNNHDIWAGASNGGLLHIDIATGKIIEQLLHYDKNPESPGSNNVLCVTVFNKDTLAIATSKGIDLFDVNKKTFSHITENDGLPGGDILSLAADDMSNIWFTSAEGIAKIHLPDKRIHEYGRLDGVTEKDFQLSAVSRLKDGKIVFGNTRGFVYFNPAVINESTAPSDVTISGFRIFDKSCSVDSLLQYGNKINLRHFQNYVTIQFASLGNIMYNRPVYYYMLEGINKDWISTQDPEAIYSYLPAGTYTFKVKCISTEGIASANITSFTILIAPVFYKTWWFYTAAGSLVFLIVYFIYRLRINKLIAVEKLRTKVARDLHDDMGSTLSTINILSTMAKTKVAEDPVRTSEYIGKISDNSQRMMEAMDDIVWSIKPSNDSMQKITARMREFATGILEAKDIELDFKVEAKVNDVKLNMEARRDFFLIFKEAVNNVAKYSHCSKCSIHLSLHQHRLLLDIHDNGVGFNVIKADSGNGLSNMQKRAEALKGRVQVQSQQGKGTQVTLNMPVQ